MSMSITTTIGTSAVGGHNITINRVVKNKDVHFKNQL